MKHEQKVNKEWGWGRAAEPAVEHEGSKLNREERWTPAWAW